MSNIHIRKPKFASARTLTNHPISGLSRLKNALQLGLCTIGVLAIAPWQVAAATQAATPVDSPAGGTFSSAVTVTLSDTTPGAKIYYTLDGSYPTIWSKPYTGPLTFSQYTTLRAIAAASGYTTSGASWTAYSFVAPTPVIQPQSGTYTTPQTVTFSDAVPNATFYYTTDGSTPTTSSTLYTRPFVLAPSTTGTTTLSVIAVANGYSTSAVAQSLLNFQLPTGVIATAQVTPTVAASVSPSFVGLSHEWHTAQSLMGSNATGVNTIYRTLLKQILNNMHGPLILRVGGGSTDTSGPATAATTQPFLDLASALNVNYILGVNLGSDNLSLAEEQADTFLTNVPNNLAALEIGNEPDGYVNLGYRPSSYSYSSFLPEYQEWTSGISSTWPSSVPFAGPVLGTGYWIPNAQPDVQNSVLKASIITQHKYIACYNASDPLPSDILLQPSSAAPSLWQLQPYAAAAHSVNSIFRVAEMNSVCLGGQPGVSNAFSSALWAIDTMFGYANAGIDGVNWHSGYQNGYYDLFYFGAWAKNGTTLYTLYAVRPLYYGLLFFSEAAGNGAGILSTSVLTNSNLKVWVTQDNKGMAHLVIINKDQTASGNVQITLPGYVSGSVVRLTAPNYTSTDGITIGGQTFDGSPDGTLQGTATTETVTPTNNVWSINVVPTSAVLVNLSPTAP